MNHITLLGSEAVERAGSAMRQSADEMQRAASTFEAAAERLTRAMEDHACRIEEAMKEKS